MHDGNDRLRKRLVETLVYSSLAPSGDETRRPPEVQRLIEVLVKTDNAFHLYRHIYQDAMDLIETCGPPSEVDWPTASTPEDERMNLARRLSRSEEDAQELLREVHLSRWASLLHELMPAYRGALEAVAETDFVIGFAAPAIDDPETPWQQRWMTPLRADLQELVGTIAPALYGGDGLGLVRQGLPDIWAALDPLLKSLYRKRVELLGVTTSRRPPSPTGTNGEADILDLLDRLEEAFGTTPVPVRCLPAPNRRKDLLTVAERRRLVQFHARLALPGAIPAGHPTVPSYTPIPFQRNALGVARILKEDPESLVFAVHVSLTLDGSRYLAEARLADGKQLEVALSPQRHAPSNSSPHVADQDLTSLVVDSATPEIALEGITCPFSGHQTLLFRLFEILHARRHQWIAFASLRSHVWDNYDAEDATIKDALIRLRRHLRKHGLDPVAAAIKSKTIPPDGLHARFLEGSTST